MDSDVGMMEGWKFGGMRLGVGVGVAVAIDGTRLHHSPLAPTSEINPESFRHR